MNSVENNKIMFKETGEKNEKQRENAKEKPAFNQKPRTQRRKSTHLYTKSISVSTSVWWAEGAAETKEVSGEVQKGDALRREAREGGISGTRTG